MATLNRKPLYDLWSIWIDRGGTFTDVIGRAGDGAVTTLKLLSISDGYDDAAVEGMRRLLNVPEGSPFPADRVDQIKMGTTVATNALLERKGARTLFAATTGFADALILGDQTRPELFALDIVRPAPLYEGARSRPTNGWLPMDRWSAPWTPRPYAGPFARRSLTASPQPPSPSCTPTSIPNMSFKPGDWPRPRGSISSPCRTRSLPCPATSPARRPPSPTPI